MKTTSTPAYSLQPTSFHRLRRWRNHLMSGLTFLSAMIASAVLVLVLWYVAVRGVRALTIDFFVQLPTPVGVPGGGIANAIAGTFLVIGLAAGFALPIGLGAGVYLSEFGANFFADAVRFLADVLSGVPSIVMGIFAYGLIVVRQGHFSALSGAFALGMIMLPYVTRTAEEALRMVPNELRESGLALGLPRWRVILFVVFPAASQGILTGVLLAVARVAGETAPLLFTAFGNPHWSLDMERPIATLPHTLFTYAIAPYADWQTKAWGAALVLSGIILITNLGVRAINRRGFGLVS